MSERGRLVVKLLPAQSTDKRTVSGWASTKDIDRVGDIVEPSGMQVSLPISLLWGHDHNQIIGSVTAAYPDANGIRINAEIVEGTAKADEAWKLIKAEALTSLSIGFIGLKYEPLNTGGRRWTSWELTELSAVAVPANKNARITATSNAKSLERRDMSRMSRDVQTALLQACGRFIKKQIAERDEVIKSLQNEVARLSENPISYQGLYSRLRTYRRGDVVTSRGSAFYCLRDGVDSQPLQSECKSEAVHKDWQLFVHRGRDAARRTE